MTTDDHHAREGLGRRYRQLTEEVLGRLGVSSPGYWITLAVSGALMLLGAGAWGLQLSQGMGLSGLQHPVMWATYITNFVWWAGIAHSGTLMSAVLYLLRAPFRPAFSRSAEAVTLITLVIAAAFPVIHLGRAWRFYWVAPYPNQRDLWVNFSSVLSIDMFAVLADFGVAFMFFWLGLIPDLALVRDRARGWRRTIYGLLSLGWEGTGRQWKHYLMAYPLLAALAAALVTWAHSIVSWDFALSIVPQWHSTLFAPYFVAGAIFSGLAMVLTLLIPTRALLKLESCITAWHLDWIARLVLMASLMVTFAHAIDYYLTWSGGDGLKKIVLLAMMRGPFAPYFWVMTFCVTVVPLALLWPRVRGSLPALFLISVLVNVGMWLERFVLITASLARDYLPYAWATEPYSFSLVEGAIFIGSLGAFLFCYLLFVRYLPVLPIAEYRRELLKEHREARALQVAENEVAA